MIKESCDKPKFSEEWENSKKYLKFPQKRGNIYGIYNASFQESNDGKFIWV